MPGWHELTKDLQRDGKLQMIGIIEEQHPERCQLFMQWKQMNWPIMVDSLNLLEVSAVPITLLIDESGRIRFVRPGTGDVKMFMNASPPVELRLGTNATRPDLGRLKERLGTSGGWTAFASGLVNWADSSRLQEAIHAYERALELQPADGPTHFRLGVAYRKRHDSPHRQPGDFGHAVEHWTRALEIDPNQYIWRRRIQQYGPRLDKPYPFYDWIQTAREEIRARGGQPKRLLVEPTGAEIAAPAKDVEPDGRAHPQPDPQARIHRDERPMIEVESVVVASTGSSGAAARVHVMFRPNRSVQAHWNNESGPLVVWVDPPGGWALSSRYLTAPNAGEAVSDELREIEFELKRNDVWPAEPVAFDGYALYYVCEGVNGTCLYRRQDFTIALPPAN